jgi:peptidoglycan hydrolase-like protein with peptidoglycan-binding domain
MSLFTDPPTTTKTSFREGDFHLGVWAIQRLLNVVYAGKMTAMTEDGAFGPQTDITVRKYQADVGIVADGIVGQKTQQRMVRSVIVRVPHGGELPKGLLEGQINLESGGYLAAANDSVAGGVDLGLTQRRVYGPPFSAASVMQAMDPLGSVSLSVAALWQNADKYANAHLGCPFNRWELAVLAHNWPVAADQFNKYGHLLSPNKIATWAPSPMTWNEWCHYYVEAVTKDVVW